MLHIQITSNKTKRLSQTDCSKVLEKGAWITADPPYYSLSIYPANASVFHHLNNHFYVRGLKKCVSISSAINAANLRIAREK